MINSGIYKIINLVNSKIYVGSSIDIRNRINHHRSELSKNIHANTHLQRAYNKYGIDSFKFEIIEHVDNVNKLLEREQYWIDTLNVCNDKLGYNICPNAGNSIGRRISKKHKIALEERLRGNKRALEYKHTTEAKVRMSQFRKSLPEEFLIQCMKNAHSRLLNQEAMKEKNRKVSQKLKGRPSPMKGRKHTDVTKQKIVESNCKKVINLNTGEIFNSLKEAASIYTKTTRSSIGSVCAGRYKTASGCKWSFYKGEI